MLSQEEETHDQTPSEDPSIFDTETAIEEPKSEREVLHNQICELSLVIKGMEGKVSEIQKEINRLTIVKQALEFGEDGASNDPFPEYMDGVES